MANNQELSNSLPTVLRKRFFRNISKNEIKKNEIEKRKQNPKQKSGIQLNVQPSVSRFQNELLKKANQTIKNNENFKFAYADMHGNFKFVLNNPLNRKYLKQFRNENSIINIVSAYCEEDKS